jgi:DNA-binding MarR family transcriptional regulator
VTSTPAALGRGSNVTVTAVRKRARLDHETRVGKSDHEALRLWLRMLTCTNLIESEIRAGLRASFECTLPRFDLMAQLERHPEGLKMGELSRRLMVTGGNITGITDQLVKEGLVTRDNLPNDRRAFLIKLTAAGRKSFQRMAQEHEQWIIRLFSRLSDRERRQLQSLLGSLKTGLTNN